MAGGRGIRGNMLKTKLGMCKMRFPVMMGLQTVWEFLDRKEICEKAEILGYIKNHLLNFKICLITVDVFFYSCVVTEAKHTFSL